MYLFDNNMIKLLVAGDENVALRVQQNIGSIWLSSVAAEEVLMGKMDGMNRARSARNSLSLPRAHQDFVQALEDLRLLPLLTYSDEAEHIFHTLPAAAKRKGTQDCRIAAQALAHNLTVVTRNQSDFQAIGAPCEDWSAPSA